MADGLVDTANRWVNLRAIKRLVNTGRLTNEILCVSKFFDNAIGISITESRFHPLNATSDLHLLKSDLYTFRHGVLTRNPARTNPLNPTIRLGHEFAMVGDFQSRFISIPGILELDNLTVSGDVWFGANITPKNFQLERWKPRNTLNFSLHLKLILTISGHFKCQYLKL
ncbi:hypothetical protein L6164_000251 [Bauhinia variegata]|uniref:Uncharacterized protein n=1 Tax=Bauhinia variegata TaxID=167791 RepID=A0ACB9Q5X4_BAUVA|nr:hypothetical protein L6164_000251 [Bauhinia variegata]